MVDDKLRILTAMKRIWGNRLTTVWPRQGQFIRDVLKLNADAKQFLRDKLFDHKTYIDKHGQDVPEIRDWKWSRSGK